MIKWLMFEWSQVIRLRGWSQILHIGLVSRPNLCHKRSSLKTLSAEGFEIWISEDGSRLNLHNACYKWRGSFKRTFDGHSHSRYVCMTTCQHEAQRYPWWRRQNNACLNFYAHRIPRVHLSLWLDHLFKRRGTNRLEVRSTSPHSVTFLDRHRQESQEMRIVLEVHDDCAGNAANDHWKGQGQRRRIAEGGNGVHLLLDYLLWYSQCMRFPLTFFQRFYLYGRISWHIYLNYNLELTSRT